MYLDRMHFKNVYTKAVKVTNEIVKVISLRIGILYVPIECLNYDLVRRTILKTIPCLVPLKRKCKLVLVSSSIIKV